MSRTAFFAAQLRVIESVLWSLCKDLEARGGVIRWPEDASNLPEITGIILDASTFIQCSGGDLRNLTLGSFANYGDPKVRRRLQSVVRDPIGFQSVMTELSYAAWHLSKGHSVTAYEEAGWPDFEIVVPDLPISIVADCKRIGAAARDERVQRVIKDANRQIKELSGPHYGVAVLDVSERIPHDLRLSDAIPKVILELRDQAIATLRSQNSSVNAAVLIWDDSTVLGEPSEPSSSMVVYRRRSLMVPHAAPRNLFAMPPDTLAVGNTVTYRVLWEARRTSLDVQQLLGVDNREPAIAIGASRRRNHRSVCGSSERR